MDRTLFLYIDILGFSDLIKQREKVEWLYATLDKAAIHRDANYRAIVFSDTIVAYNMHTQLKSEAKANELMFLMELAQELFLRLIGPGVFFRAVITEGEFTHRHLKHFDAFYGQALVDTYRAEKTLVGVGLFLEQKLRPYNQIFRYQAFSESHDFVCLTHQCTHLTPAPADIIDPHMACFADPDFPLPGLVLTASSVEFLVYPELVHFREVYELMNDHPDPKVRAKFLNTWKMYLLAYPKLLRSLQENEFKPESVAALDWNEAKKRFNER